MTDTKQLPEPIEPQKLIYQPLLKGHYFPAKCKAEYPDCAFLWNGGTSPSNKKLANPEFRAKVEKDLERIRNGTGMMIGVAFVEIDRGEEFHLRRGPVNDIPSEH